MDKILKLLRQNGERITKSRSGIIQILTRSKYPVCVEEIIKLLKKNNIYINKTTVYREIEFLKKYKLIRNADFGDGKMRFEPLTQKHHHHVICVKCSRVEDIVLKTDIRLEQSRIQELVNYKVLNHSLEFFGLCPKCR